MNHHSRPAPFESAHSQERRANDRVASADHAYIAWGNRSTIVKLLNLSRTGAQLQLATGTSPSTGDRLVITLLDKSILAGSVVWLKADRIGVDLDTIIDSVEERSGNEHLGQSYYAQTLAIQRLTRPKNR
jgi:hypothetical protein